MKREAKFTLQFRHWLKANPMHNSAFELKHTSKDSIPFSDVQEHQINALQAVKSKGGFLYKAPDDSRGAKPFDLFYMREAYAWVVVKYPKCFVIINVDLFALESKKSKRRSLTSSRAKDIAWKIVPTK